MECKVKGRKPDQASDQRNDVRKSKNATQGRGECGDKQGRYVGERGEVEENDVPSLQKCHPWAA